MSRSYRRLLALAEGAITVAELVGPMELWAAEPDVAAHEVGKQMRELGYDAAPLRDKPIRRYVTVARLRGCAGPAAGAAQPIDASVLVSSALPLGQAVGALETQPFLFVLGPAGVEGMLTRADLQLAPVSMVVLGFIVAGEAALDVLIERAHGEAWTSLIPPGRLRSIENVFDTRRKADAEITRLECLNLDDRLTIVRKTPSVRRALGYGSGVAFDEAMKPLKALRNVLAHGGGLLDADPDPVRAVRRFTDVRTLAERAWAEVDGAR